MWRVLLQLYPREFREEYGADMMSAFRHAYASEQGVGRLRFAAGATGDAFTTAIQEHRHIMIRDLVQSLRRLSAHPATTLVAVLSLALGIGASTAMFSILY